MLHDSCDYGRGFCLNEQLPVAGDNGTTGSARLSERVDDAGEQCQLQGGPSLLCGPDAVGRIHRPKRRGDGATARFHGYHREYF